MYIFFKRIFDFIISLCLIIFASPILIIINIWLYFINNNKGVFFYQDRIGKDSAVFKVIKYKTMNDELDSNGNLLSDEIRLTKIGKFLRSTSIDELPQLINVLKGDMSLVGPRPLLVQYLPLYSKEQARRHKVRPGITGWAQIKGRNTISWQQKFEYDLWYVDHMSFIVDIKIILLTIIKVLFRKDINSKTSATMEPFIGNN